MAPPSSADSSGGPIKSEVAISKSDDKSAVSSVTHGSKSTSTSALVSLVKEQVSLVRNLTNANKSASEELQRVQEEKKKIEEEYRKMQEQAKTQRRASASNPQPQPPVATPLGAIPENGWVPFSPPGIQTDGFGNEGFPTPPVTPSPPPAAASAAVEVFDDLGPRATVVPGRQQRSGPPEGAAPRGAGQCDEWSTVVYPSARNVVAAEAMPCDDIEAQIQPKRSEKRRGRSFRRKKKSPSRPPPEQPKKTIPLVSTDPAPELKIPEKKVTCASRFWASFSRLCTFFIPDLLICRKGAAAKQAWREKVAIFLIMIFTSAFFVGIFGFIPLFLCTEQTLYTWEDIYAQNNGVLFQHREAWTVVHGQIYDVKNFINKHTGGAAGVQMFLGQDASKLFPRTPPADLPGKCLNPDSDLSNYTKPECLRFDDVDRLVGTPCHDFATGMAGMNHFMGEYKRGTLAWSMSSLAAQNDFDWIVLNNKVYNVTAYVDGIKGRSNAKPNKNSPNAYLNDKLTKMIINRLNQDATQVFDALYAPEVAGNYQLCLNHLFFAGEIDTRDDPVCGTFNIIMYVMLILVASILVLQCLCSLLYVARKNRTLTTEMVKQHVMVMIPCYNEGDKELRKTIRSVLDTVYPDENKVMLVVADGLITGRGENCSTPETIAKMLGYSMDKDRDTAHFYKSIGANERNRAFVYHGRFKKDDRELKYIVVVKCGTTKERSGARAGNRGKRDSQLIIAGLFNRVHYGRELCELDVAICRALNELDVSIEDLKYLMAIDADTRVHKDSTSQMVFSMEKDESILACCGETRVDNKAQSWVTMIQVYEYYSSHHMKKAFESVFGCVTCLPGCFTMYRIRSNDNRPLLACDYVYGEYARNDIESLHEKNLYHLGEDRMLTTLLLQYFSDMKLSFVPEAICWTIVPHTFRILLSQRRRWVNSTFHNMWELLKVRTMCGICICSMKTVVIADMISTMILPASMVYAGYFVYLVFVKGEAMSTTLVIIYGVIIGCQMLIFIVRSRWDYLFWFLAFFIFGVPVFYFFLPLYAFWHMDDLSWGQTRQVAGGDNPSPTPTAAAAQPGKGGADKKSARAAAATTSSSSSSSPQRQSRKADAGAARSSSSPSQNGSAARQSQQHRSSAQGSGGGDRDRPKRKTSLVQTHSGGRGTVDMIPIHEL